MVDNLLNKLPSDWELKTLKDIADVSGGKRLPKGQTLIDENTGYPYIRVSDMSKNGVFTSNLKYVPRETVNSIQRYRINKGDLYISVAGTLGLVGKISDELDGANLTENADRISNIQCHTDYLLYCLRSQLIQDIISRESTTNAQPKLALTRIKKFLIPCPPSFEQQKIAGILSSVDNAIEKNEAIIEQTEKVKKGLMQQLLTKGIGHTKFKKTEIGEIPEEWEVSSLDNLTSIITNGFVGVASPYYSDDKEAIPYLMSNNVRANRIDVRKLTHVLPEFNEKYKKSVLQKYDMLTVQSGHIGTTCVVPEKYEGGNCHALIISRFSDPRINPYFVSLYINSLKGMARLSSIFVGSTIKHINVKDFKKFVIPIPSYTEQTEIVEKVESINQKFEIEQQKLTQLQTLKEGLMQVLLTGKVRVKVDEPEAVNT
jgi:type I restriction enzyme S subunit